MSPQYRYHAAVATFALLLLTASSAMAERAVVSSDGKTWGLASPSGLRVPHDSPEGVVLHRAVPLGDAMLAVGVAPFYAGGQRISLLRAGRDGVEELPAPSVAYDRVVSTPTPLVADGALRKLLWIEGSATNETRVQSADWSGAGWSQPVTVSDFGPGTQIALDAVHLADGSFLAVWARFDGHDDEIVWSRFDGEWSAPAAITDNDVPDVTPALLATADGAAVAWSAYDGNDYRIRLSHFSASSKLRWATPETLGDKASTWPAFDLVDGGEPVLTWRQPASWRVAQLDAAASVLWTVEVPRRAATSSRPLAFAASSAGDGALHLLWLGGTQTEKSLPTSLVVRPGAAPRR